MNNPWPRRAFTGLTIIWLLSGSFMMHVFRLQDIAPWMTVAEAGIFALLAIAWRP